MTKLIIIKLITYYSIQYGIDPQVALAVAKHESGFNPNAISETGDYGIFQLNHRSFPEYSKIELLNPQLNIKLGIKYLIKMKNECNYKEDIQWLLCYNFGIQNAKKVKHPSLWPYTRKIASIMGENHENY